MMFLTIGSCGMATVRSQFGWMEFVDLGDFRHCLTLWCTICHVLHDKSGLDALTRVPRQTKVVRILLESVL